MLQTDDLADMHWRTALRSYFILFPASKATVVGTSAGTWAGDLTFALRSLLPEVLGSPISADVVDGYNIC